MCRGSARASRTIPALCTRLEVGDRLFVRCDGGPSQSRLELFPPRLEVDDDGGTYILVDDGPRERWRYVFVPREA